MKRTMTGQQRQTGSFLIEALVSLMIFMIGLIALLGVAAQATNQLGQSKFRNDASYLAGELIGEMWVTAGTPAAFNWTAWRARVADTLPGGLCPVASCYVTGTMVVLDITWTDKKDPAVTHHYQTTAQVAKNS